MEKIHVYLNIKEKYIPTDFKYIQIYNKRINDDHHRNNKIGC